MSIGMFFAYLMVGLMGWVILVAHLYVFKKRRSCTEERQAKFLGIKRRQLSQTVSIKGQFEIEIRGKKESWECLDDISVRKWKQFKEGEIYTVYVNPDKPYEFRCTNKIYYKGEIMWAIMGGLFLAGALFSMVTELISWIMTYI